MKNQSILYPPRISDAATFAASQYIATGLSFITTIGAARILGPSDYGITALIIAYPNLLWSFVGIKSISVTTRYMANFRAIGKNEELKGICKLGYSLDFFIAVVAFLLVSITSWWVAHHFYNMPNIWWLMVCYAASIPIFSLTETSRAILFSWQRFRWLSIFQILDKLIMLFLVLGFLLAGFGVRGMIIATALSQAITGVIMMVATTYLLFRDGLGFWWKCSLKSIIPLQKELSSIFGWNYLFVTLRGLVTYLPQMLLGYFRGPQEAGFYRLATSLVTVGSYPETSLGRIAYPILSSRWSEGKQENLKSTIRRWTFYGGIPMGILMLLTIPLISIFVPAVFGSDYILMIPGVKVMMAGAVVSAVFFWLTSFYYALGRVAIWTKGYALYTTIVIVLGWFCIQQWGFLGLAILITVARVVFTLSMAMGFKESPLRRSKPQGRDSIYNHKIVCFTFWFPIHNNPRYSGLIPKLICKVKFYKVTLSRHRLIRALQYHLWVAIKNKFIYPVVLWFLGRRHATLFCVDVHQIPAWPRKKSVVVDIDDPVFSPTEVRLLNLPQVKAIIVTTEKAKENFKQLDVINPIHVIPQGISMEQINSHRIKEVRTQFKEENDLVVGYCAPTLTLSCDGSRRPRQGLDDLDFLFSRVEDARKAEPRIKLWLLGEPSKSVKEYVIGGRQSWIKLCGYISSLEILNYISNFDIALYHRTHPDFTGFRVKIAQYMACGVPIISTNFEESTIEIIKEARCGIICDSQEDFAKALVELAQSPEMRLELGKAGKQYAVENLNWSILAQRYTQIFK